MGTSQSHNLKSTPNWSSAKRAITSIANGTGNADKNNTKFMRSLGSALGSGIYRGKSAGGRKGHSSTFGRAGGRAATNFISFISDTRNKGLAGVLNFTDLSQQQQPQTPRDFIDRILQQIVGENDSNMDDGAAAYAMDCLLNEILKDCNDSQEIEDRFCEATDDDIHRWIIDFEIEYILEFSAELFQSHIFDKGSNPESIKNQIRNWLHNELDDRLKDNLSKYDLTTSAGKAILDTLTADIIEIWGQ